jgi:hypothetical protein
LCCLSFFDLIILITPLVSSNSSFINSPILSDWCCIIQTSHHSSIAWIEHIIGGMLYQ